MIGHRSSFQENGNLPVWRDPAMKKRLPFSNVHALRESSFNMTRRGWGVGGWGYWNSKLEILEAPPSPATQFLGACPLLLVWSMYTNFRSPPPPLIFSEPPFWVSKNFQSPPQYLHPPSVSYYLNFPLMSTWIRCLIVGYLTIITGQLFPITL